MLNEFDKSKTELLPSIFRERMSVNRDYLAELDTQCLLQNFYLEAGIIMPGLQVIDNPETAKLHWGWEAPTCQLRGHFLGHWLSAAAALIANTNDAELRAKLDKIVAELARCQQLNGGEWIGSVPEKYFRKLAEREYIWSPQYVMHKTIMGLFHAYLYAHNEQALNVVSRLADWYVRWTDEMLKTAPYAVYSGEAGGMLEIWAWLYEITRDGKYLLLAQRYMDDGLLRSLSEGKDALTNSHANASIPLSHGAAKMYEITGEEKWRSVVEAFWKSAVTDRGTYCTGGMNAGEFWVPPFMQGEFLGDTNQEFCTVYNMTRTAQYLYKWTGDKKYADYIEKCLYNGFLAQQNQNSGMPTYFLPLSAGSHKKWGSKTRDFWCCHGTMVQAQTLYPDLIYMNDVEHNRLVVSQYIPSRLSCAINGKQVTLEQTTSMKYYNDQAFFDEHDDSQMSRWALKFKITADAKSDFTLSLRVPSWIKSEPQVKRDGQPCTDIVSKDGYMNFAHISGGCEIEVFFPNAVVMEPLPDMPELSAMVDGPIVLAGITDADYGLVGDFAKPEEFIMPQTEHTYGTYPWKQSCYRTRRQPKNFTLKPLYDVTDEAYTVYFSKR